MAGINIIDAFDFSRQGKEASGSMPLARFARAMEDLPMQPRGEAGEVRWWVRGEIGSGASRGNSVGNNPTAGNPGSGANHLGVPLLWLRVQAAPVLVCQRCMEPFAYAIDSTIALQLVKSEAELDTDDHGENSDDPLQGDGDDGEAGDIPEKVVGSHRFDLLAQVEDELILSIPYVPKHEICPGAPAKTGAGEPEPVKRPSPFAVLEKLKQKD